MSDPAMIALLIALLVLGWSAVAVAVVVLIQVGRDLDRTSDESDRFWHPPTHDPDAHVQSANEYPVP